MTEVSHAERVVYPAVGVTKGDVVAYYEAIAPRLLPHVRDRPLSLQRFPRGLAAPGFFQKNVPAHYPQSIARFAVPRSKAAARAHPRRADAGQAEEVTLYPLVTSADHLGFLANQGALELHVPLGRVPEPWRPDRLVLDLDPPAGALALVRRAALLVRDFLGELGLVTVPVATGSKGYHVVAAVASDMGGPVRAPDAARAGTDTVAAPSPALFAPTELSVTLQKLALLLAARHPDELTAAFRIAQRKGRVFVDWLRNRPGATVIAPYSLRARPQATVAVPLAWEELEAVAPDAFTIADRERLLGREDPLADLVPAPAAELVARVDAAFEASGIELVPFDRFRS